MRFNVYVDGFNLYYGALRGQPYRWLDIRRLARELLGPRDEVRRVRYFTARVRPLPGDPTAPDRQAAYIRALRTLPDLSIHYGHFLVSRTTMVRADGRGRVRVLKTEEKGTDVNLATHLLLDAFDQDCDAALVVSNDSDLVEPIRQVRARFDLTVGVVLPILNGSGSRRSRRPSKELADVATFDRRITNSVKTPHVRNAQGAPPPGSGSGRRVGETKAIISSSRSAVWSRDRGGVPRSTPLERMVLTGAGCGSSSRTCSGRPTAAGRP